MKSRSERTNISVLFLVSHRSNHFRYEDIVVQDNFKFGDDKEIVSLLFLWGLVDLCSPNPSQIVALQNNVLAINKKNLKKPTRSSLAAPIGSLQSRSHIVNAPY